MIIYRPFAVLFAVCLPVLCGCSDLSSQDVTAPVDTTLFGGPMARGLLTHAPINEASGLVASRANPGVLWVHNDSGDGPHLYALDTSGNHLGIYTLGAIQARDWEDLTLGPGPEPGQDYLYVGDIGDNESRRDLKYVYRVPEPIVGADQTPIDTTLTRIDTMALRYPDGKTDAETIMLDPLTKDLYVVAKRRMTVNVYRATYPQSTVEAIDMELLTRLTVDPVPNAGAGGQGPTGGDIAPSGLEMLIKTYNSVYYYTRASEAVSLFDQPSTKLPYVLEPQGEAIAWAADGSGYFTVSEELRSIPATLLFYPRLPRSQEEK